jgi:hypothetical protein
MFIHPDMPMPELGVTLLYQSLELSIGDLPKLHKSYTEASFSSSSLHVIPTTDFHYYAPLSVEDLCLIKCCHKTVLASTTHPELMLAEPGPLLLFLLVFQGS